MAPWWLLTLAWMTSLFMAKRNIDVRRWGWAFVHGLTAFLVGALVVARQVSQ